MGNFYSLGYHDEYFGEYRIELERIYNDRISVKRVDSQQSRAVMKYVMDEILLPSFQKDKHFSEFYKEIYNTGSYFDGLRVNNAKEFDVNVVFYLPAKFSVHNGLPGHARLLDRESFEYKSVKDFKKYFRRLVDEACPIEFVFENENYIIRRSESGPASTITISRLIERHPGDDLVKRKVFDLDLAPVFEYIDYDNIDRTNFLVPKSPAGGDKDQWRLSYPRLERELLEGKPVAKKVIKILKRLRDNQKWDELSSYYIKTVVLHCLKIESEKRHEDLVYMLNKSVELLLEYLNKGNIPFYHDNRYNLLQNMDGAKHVSVKIIWLDLIIIRSQVEEGAKFLYEYL